MWIWRKSSINVLRRFCWRLRQNLCHMCLLPDLLLQNGGLGRHQDYETPKAGIGWKESPRRNCGYVLWFGLSFQPILVFGASHSWWHPKAPFRSSKSGSRHICHQFCRDLQHNEIRQPAKKLKVDKVCITCKFWISGGNQKLFQFLLHFGIWREKIAVNFT